MSKIRGGIFMNLKQAQYIKEIAASGSITGAAQKLYISQPSLSQTLAQAEKELGLPIFYRKSSPLRLTYAGEKYLQAANAMLAVSRRLDDQISELKKETGGRLRLGISVQRGIQILSLVIPRFRNRFPAVKLELVESGSASLEALVSGGQLDLALAAVEAVNTRLIYELIETEVIGIIAGRDSNLARAYPAGTPVSVENVDGDSMISMKPGHSIRVVQDQLFRRHGLVPDIVLETESMEIGKRVALAAGALMLCPNIYVDREVREQGAFYPLRDYENHRHFYACYPRREQLPRYAIEFIRIVSDVCRERGRENGNVSAPR